LFIYHLEQFIVWNPNQLRYSLCEPLLHDLGFCHNPLSMSNQAIKRLYNDRGQVPYQYYEAIVSFSTFLAFSKLLIRILNESRSIPLVGLTVTKHDASDTWPPAAPAAHPASAPLLCSLAQLQNKNKNKNGRRPPYLPIIMLIIPVIPRLLSSEGQPHSRLGSSVPWSRPHLREFQQESFWTDLAGAR
jgi:hypothetical protein